MGFRCEDHAGFADEGSDVCCASISSAVMLTANGITEVLGLSADVAAYDATVELVLRQPSVQAQPMLEAFHLHMENLKKEFPENIQISEQEV